MKPFIEQDCTIENIIKLEDGRVYPVYDGKPLSWDLGSTWDDEKDGSPRLRAVVRAMIALRPEQLERERRELIKASFDRMFGRNAAKVLAVVDDEITKRKRRGPK